VSAPVWLGVAVLGGLGATARFAVDLLVSYRAEGEFPLGTLVVNLSGTLALGILAGAVTDDAVLRLFATGLLGAYTTFSTWSFQSQRLAEDGAPRLALANILISLALGLAAIWIGMQVGEALAG
jgi:CrcB protein